MTLEVLHLLLNSKVARVRFALLLYEGFSLSPNKLINILLIKSCYTSFFAHLNVRFIVFH